MLLILHDWLPEEMYFWGALKWTHTMRLSGLWDNGECKVIKWRQNKIRTLKHGLVKAWQVITLEDLKYKCLPPDYRWRGWGVPAQTHLSVAAVHHVVHHGGRRHWGQVSRLLRRLTCHRNRLLGQSEASPRCGILTKKDPKKWHAEKPPDSSHTWYIHKISMNLV